MRKSSEEIRELMIEENVDRIWSWSKINTYINDPYSYLLAYIRKIEGDKQSNAYSFFGGIVHDMLEDYYNNEIDRAGMLKNFENKTTIQELGNIRFDISDERNLSIGLKYKTCINHFLHNYIKDKEPTKLEQFIYGKIGKHLFQGYIDKLLVRDNILYIDDFKSSTIYRGKKINEEKGQLLLYSIILSQRFNIPMERIRARWNFLKYVSIDCEQINGKIVTTHSLRNEIYSTLTAKITTWLKKFKYSEVEIQSYLDEIERKNIIEFDDMNCLNGLPSEVQEKFNIRDCLVEIPIDNAEISSFINSINETCNQIIAKEELYRQSGDEKLFWTEINPGNIFYFNNLCDYSSKLHMPLKEHYEILHSGTNTTNNIGAPTAQNDMIDNFIFSD